MSDCYTRMTIRLRTHGLPGWRSLSFHGSGKLILDRVQSPARCSSRRMEADLHPDTPLVRRTYPNVDHDVKIREGAWGRVGAAIFFLALAF